MGNFHALEVVDRGSGIRGNHLPAKIFNSFFSPTLSCVSLGESHPNFSQTCTFPTD